MIRWAIRAAALVLVLLVAGGLYVRLAGDDPARWHADPATAARTGKPNDFLAAPAGTTAATPDLILAPAEPADALAAFDRAARAAPRTTVLAGSVEEARVSYVQRSQLIGFPDYISVAAVEGGIAVWSRSRYGHSDLGVNAKRVRAWLEAAGLNPAP